MKHDRGITTLHPWNRGMCNKSPGHRLPPDTVANAVNVAFGDNDRIVTRPGIGSRIYAGLGTKAGWHCPAGQFFIEGNNLMRLNADNSATTLWSGLQGSEYTFHYVPLTGIVYFSDGVISLKNLQSTTELWGMPVPDAPTAYGVSGTYSAGVYLLAVCWVDANGVESGASEIVTVTLADNQGIAITNMPQPVNFSPTSLRIYLSTANGKELYNVADLTPGAATIYQVTAGRYDGGNLLEHQFVSPAPPGRIIRHYNGSMLVADDSGYIWYSDPQEPDHFRYDDNYLYVSDAVDVMEPVKGGVFLAYGDVTEFRGGVFQEGEDIRHIANYGGVYGTGRPIPDSDDVIWQSAEGAIRGLPDGSYKRMTDELVAPGTGESGTSIVREQDGMQQFIVKLNNPTVSRAAAQAFMDAEVIRKGA